MLNVHGKPFGSPVTEKETLKGTRGGQTDGISIHSVRTPVLVASQEVIFGALGQTLTINTILSAGKVLCGVILAIRSSQTHRLVLAWMYCKFGRLI
jgi:4-hydroxy-tetrahydrodipicolinate reductase